MNNFYHSHHLISTQKEEAARKFIMTNGTSVTFNQSTPNNTIKEGQATLCDSLWPRSSLKDWVLICYE